MENLSLVGHNREVIAEIKIRNAEGSVVYDLNIQTVLHTCANIYCHSRGLTHNIQ